MTPRWSAISLFVEPSSFISRINRIQKDLAKLCRLGRIGHGREPGGRHLVGTQLSRGQRRGAEQASIFEVFESLGSIAEKGMPEELLARAPGT